MPSAAKLLSSIGGLFAIATPVSLLATMCLGLPLVVLLRWRNALSWLSICVGATLIGAVAFALFTWVITSGQRAPTLSHYSIGAIFGLVSGVAFCVGAGLNRA